MPDLLERAVQPDGRARHAAPVVAPPSRLLWSATVTGRYGLVLVLGALALVGAWYASAGEAMWEQQRPYVSLAVAVTVLVNAGGLGLLLLGRRRIGLRRLALLGELAPGVRAEREEPAAVTSAGPSSGLLVAVPGGLRYHRSDCQLAVDKDVEEETATEHHAAGRLPCGVCRP